MAKFLQYLQECSEHSKKVALVGWAALVLSALGLVQNLLSLGGVNLPLPRVPLPWVLTIFLVGVLIVVLAGGYQRSVAEGDRFREIVGPELLIAYDTQNVGDVWRWPLAIKNLKGGTAYRVNVSGIKYADFSAKLSEIPLIEEGKVGYFQSPDRSEVFGSLLNAIVRSGNDSVTLPLSVSCEDSSNRKLEHFFELVYRKPGVPHFLPKVRKIL